MRNETRKKMKHLTRNSHKCLESWIYRDQSTLSLQRQTVDVSEDEMRELAELAKSTLCQLCVLVCVRLCWCVCVCSQSLAGGMSLRICSILPRTSGVSMMPCLSLFKHTQTDQMKDKWAHRTSLSAFLGRDGRAGSDADHTHFCTHGTRRKGDDDAEVWHRETLTLLLLAACQSVLEQDTHT